MHQVLLQHSESICCRIYSPCPSIAPVLLIPFHSTPLPFFSLHPCHSLLLSTSVFRAHPYFHVNQNRFFPQQPSDHISCLWIFFERGGVTKYFFRLWSFRLNIHTNKNMLMKIQVCGRISATQMLLNANCEVSWRERIHCSTAPCCHLVVASELALKSDVRPRGIMGVEVGMDSLLLPALTRKKFQRLSEKLFAGQTASPREDKSERRSTVSVGVLSFFKRYMSTGEREKRPNSFPFGKFCEWKCRDSGQVCFCGHVSRWGEKNTPNQYSWTMYAGFVLNNSFKTHVDMSTWILDAKVWRQSDKSVRARPVVIYLLLLLLLSECDFSHQRREQITQQPQQQQPVFAG